MGRTIQHAIVYGRFQTPAMSHVQICDSRACGKSLIDHRVGQHSTLAELTSAPRLHHFAASFPALEPLRNISIQVQASKLVPAACVDDLQSLH